MTRNANLKVDSFPSADDLTSLELSKRERRFTRNLWIFSFITLALIALGFTHPDHNPAIGPKAPGWMDLSDWGCLQISQVIVLGMATLFSFNAFNKSTANAKPLWIFVLASCFFLFWRELDLDQQYLRDRAWSWRYLVKHDVSLTKKLVLGVPSIGLSLAFIWYLSRHRKALFSNRWAWRDRRMLSLGVMGFLALVLSVIWDKAILFYKRFGVEVHDLRIKDPYAEEAFELFGELALLIVVLRLNDLQPKISETPNKPMSD